MRWTNKTTNPLKRKVRLGLTVLGLLVATFAATCLTVGLVAFAWYAPVWTGAVILIASYPAFETWITDDD